MLCSDDLRFISRWIFSDGVICLQDTQKRLELAKVLLLAFVQANWTGPPLTEPTFPLDAISEIEREIGRERILEMLVVGGEWPYRLIQFPFILVAAIRLLQFDAGYGDYPDKEYQLWKIRSIFLHQRVLENAASELLEALCVLMKDGLDSSAEFYTELSLIHQYYQNEQASAEALEKAAKAANFEHCLGGALGRRTRFQQFDTMQLIVQTKEGETSKIPASSVTPTNLELNDDVLLENVQLTKAESNSTNLSPASLKILLAQAGHLMTFYPRTKGIEEETVIAYVAPVLEKPSQWCIYSTALWLRSIMESHKTRKLERSTLQIQALVDQVGQLTPEEEQEQQKQLKDGMHTTSNDRLVSFFSTALAPPWEMDRIQGGLFAKLGAFKTALAIFTRRQQWDEAISCLVQLGETARAEEMVREQLALSPTPKLLCILGDLLGDPEHYRKAWELGGQRYARAMRSLGSFHFRRQEWTMAIDALEAALSLNALFENSWFLLGCALIQTERWRGALGAFTRVVQLNRDSSDAWNNIAAIHLRKGKTQDEGELDPLAGYVEARNALKEACRIDYNNWRVWENLARVNCVMGDDVQAVIHAYGRYVEILKGESATTASADKIDLTIFERLVMIFEGVRKEEEDNRMAASIYRMLRRLCSDTMDRVFTAKPSYWLLVYRIHMVASKLVPSCSEEAEGCDDLEHANGPLNDAKECLLRAYRAATATSYDTDREASQRVIDIVRLIESKAGELSIPTEQLYAIIDGTITRRIQPAFPDLL